MDKDLDRIAEQAADYLTRQPRETTSQRLAREAWLAADPRHARVYDRMQRQWEQIGELRDDPEIQALMARDLASLGRSRRWFGTGRVLAVAAVLILGLIAAYITAMRMSPPPPVNFISQLGERRTETLADGTRMVLNTDSAVQVRYSRRHRDVDLQRGEAQFDVAHDASRPFVVHVDGGTVTALGTRFQVRRDASAATVTLLQGKVNVAQGSEQRTLHPNEQAQLAQAGGIQVRPIDPEQAEGWLDGWLRFRNAPLGQVVAEANRYSARKLRLGDPKLASLQVSGSFQAGDSASIASLVALTLPVRVQDGGSDIVLQPR